MNSRTRGTTDSAAAATISDAQRQPCRVVTSATTGRKISCPVALAAVSTPVTSPRRCSNQRVDTVATKPIEMAPVPTPTSTPHSSTSCQLVVMTTDSAEPVAISTRAAESTGRTPRRSIRAAANGAVRPNSVMLTDMASPTVPCDQPNSWCRGFIITPGTERKPAAPRIAMKLTAATTQAQCRRGRRLVSSRVVTVTRSLSRPSAASASGMNDTSRQKHAIMVVVHRVAVLLLPPVVGFDATIPSTLFGAAEDADGNPLYEVVTCGVTTGRVPSTNGFDIVPAAGPEVLATADTVIVPGTRYAPARDDGTLAPEVRAALDSIRPGTRLVSICTGAFVLAAAGLLDGRPATTHWKFADALAANAPRGASR